MNYLNALKQFARDEDGVTAIEYGLIAALIAVVIIASVKLVGQNLSTCSPTSPRHCKCTDVANARLTALMPSNACQASASVGCHEHGNPRSSNNGQNF